MRWLKRGFWILVLITVILFAAMNMQRVDITLLPFAPADDVVTGVSLPLAFVIFVTLLIGLLVGMVLENDRERPYRRELTQAKGEVNRLRRDLARLEGAMKEADTPETAGLLLPRR